MVEIKEITTGFQVSGAGFDEVFQSRFKATMAAHAVALWNATASGRAVAIVMPDGWGDTVLVEPAPASAPVAARSAN